MVCCDTNRHAIVHPAVYIEAVDESTIFKHDVIAA
ncbi:MAG: zinc-finger domain-containing protein [Balneolales bacterium]|nr:zinc-finger domain-containing protein [Balneolales bacterium]